MVQGSVRGIDIAKQLFHIVAMDDTGTVVWRKCLTRSALTAIKKLTPQGIHTLHRVRERLRHDNKRLEAICQADPVCQRLLTMPGIGPSTATALVAAVSDATHFKNGRRFAAWLGLVPRQGALSHV